MQTKVINHLMKMKNTDGSFDILFPYTASGNVKTTEAIEVKTDNSIGLFKNGDIITADTSVDEILRKLLQQQVPPTYTAPNVSFSVAGMQEGLFEVGTLITGTFTSIFTRNDAGEIQKLTITKNGEEQTSSTTPTATYTATSITLETDTEFKAVATYAAGAIKQDNLGEDYPEGVITAGTINSGSITYKAYRKYFFGVDTETSAVTTSDEVRALTGSEDAAVEGMVLDIKATAGQRRVTIAYPATLPDISIVYTDFGTDDITSLFTKTTVAVQGANAFTAVDYKVYTYIAAQPFVNNMNFRVTF